MSRRFQVFKEKFFPERQLFLRSEGRVSFIKLGSRLQMSVTSALLIFFGWVAVTSITFMSRDLVIEGKDVEIANLRADYQELDNDYYKLDEDVKGKVTQLGERQEYLQGIIEGKDLPEPDEPATNSNNEPSDKKTIKDNSQATLIERILGSGTANASVDLSRVSERNATLSRIKDIYSRQQHLASELHGRSINKLAQIEIILKNTPVNLDRLVKQYEGDTSGMGGPYIPELGFSPLFTGIDNKIFESLQTETLRLDIATSALDSFPTGEPAAKYYVSSRFGGRTDPFTKRRASHPGLDMAGWPGTAIQAATDGIVITAGNKPAYGLMVEIDHGNGFHTRYGHMKKLRVKKGDKVTIGQRIGDMGKTGRATSSHLHYEIWFEGKVHDPLPFIKAAEDVRKIQGRYESS